jgi:UDP-3-O-[3-hydroxymyristoyl] glucosamine N-acyltransferase
MPDSRFYNRDGPFDLATLAEICEGQLNDNKFASLQIEDIGTLEQAGPRHIACFHNKKYLKQFQDTKAGAVIISEENIDKAPKGVPLIISKTAYRSFALVTGLLYPDEAKVGGPSSGIIHERAIIHPTATIGSNVTIEAGAVIDEGVEIGSNTIVGANTIIAKNVVVGDDCYIGPLVYITHAIIGNEVTIHGGAMIGRSGFGFSADSKGVLRLPQVGRVIIEDNVEIGSNTNIDRGSCEDTIIGSCTMVDAQVMFGHNVQIGSGCIIVAQSGFAGSSKLANFVQVGGKAAINGHISIEDGARIAAVSAVMRDVKAGETVIGYPAEPYRDYMRRESTIRKLVKQRTKK